MNVVHLTDEPDDFPEHEIVVTDYQKGSWEMDNAICLHEGDGEALTFNGEVNHYNLSHCSCYGPFDLDKGGPDTYTVKDFFERNSSAMAPWGTVLGETFAKLLKEKTMFSAEEARKLAGETVEEKVEKLLVAVQKAAKNKKRELKTGWEYKEDQDLWVQGGYSRTKEYNQAVKLLEDLGYKVEFYYSEGSFAVDMYTIVRW